MWSLPRAVESCRAARCDVEVVVIDDGSRDGTWDWLSGQQGIVAIRQPNLGKGWAVQAGLKRATGRYVKFLDSDDAIVAAAIDRQVSLADATGADLVFSGITIVDEAGTEIERRSLAAHDDFIALQLGEGDGSHYSAFLFRHELVANIPHRVEYGAVDDRMFILEVALAHPKVVNDPEPTLLHTHHSRDRMQGYQGMAAVVMNHARLQLFKRILQRLLDAGELTPRRRRAVAPQLWSLAHWIGYTHPAEALAVADWVQRLAPDYVPQRPDAIGRTFRILGFRRAEQLFRMRRNLLRLFRRRPKPPNDTFPA